MPPKNKYLTNEALRQTVAEAIARLELDRHQVNLALLVHGKDIKVGDAGETIDEAFERITRLIQDIEDEYADVLTEE